MSFEPLFVPLVLAAGRGRRMGRPKALLEVAGVTALARCLAAYAVDPTHRHLGTPIVVCAGTEAAEIRRRCPGATVVTNPDPERGQTSSVQAGLRAMPAGTNGCLVHPVDHPLVGADDVDALVAGALAAPEARVVLPSHAGRAGHPALVRSSLVPEILALAPDAPLRAVLRAHREQTCFITRHRPGVIVDLDTPADLAAALALLERAHDASDPHMSGP